MERLVTFRNQGLNLYGMLHLPCSAGPWPGVALLHGFSGHRSESHFIFTKQARHLAQNGVAALRFDFRGSGESEGDFADMTIEGEISDASAALDFLATQSEIDGARLGLLGLSLGGCVAACLAGRDRRVQALVLWSTPANLVDLMTKGAASPSRIVGEHPKGHDVGGLVVGPGFIRDLVTLRPLEEITQLTGPALVIHGTNDESVPCDSAEQYLNALSDHSTVRLVQGADHTFSSIAWEEEVIAASTEWFRDHL